METNHILLVKDFWVRIRTMFRYFCGHTTKYNEENYNFTLKEILKAHPSTILLTHETLKHVKYFFELTRYVNIVKSQVRRWLCFLI